MNNDDGSGHKKLTFMQRLGARLDISPDIINGIFIELRGRNNLTVHGCREIILYTTEKVRVKLPGSVLSVCGDGLYCTAYHSGVAQIDGIISSVSFDDAGDKSET